ncbi:unnamed protein product [Rodentolepis nana]|uniref:Separase n=1 Tax=Rodentolepis nana TaxID=102285 RepID=A0A0R3TAD9_RODNA|nr:unnamed protein product [Rodentolepis nana]
MDVKYAKAIHESTCVIKNADLNGFNPHKLSEFSLEFIRALICSYNFYKKSTNPQSLNQSAELLKIISVFQRTLLNETYLGVLKGIDFPPDCLANLLAKSASLATTAEDIDLLLAFHGWKFVSQLLASFHVQIKEAFLENLYSCNGTPISDEFISSLLLSCKRLFIKCSADSESHGLEENGEPKWRGKLKLIAFICRLMVGCLQQFQSVLFLTTENYTHRRVIDFISWIIEVQFAGGLFSSGTGLDENFLKEVSTSLFVASEMILKCICQIESDSGHEASSATKALVLTNLTPLVNCRILSKVLVNLSKRHDPAVFKLWLSEEFNAYAEFFTNLDAAFADWRPYETVSNASAFHVPRFLNFKTDQKHLSSAVEQFLTTLTVEISKSVRNLPHEFFGYLETALLESVLHASSVVSIVAQDIWCFVVRYGSAELCWQYVILLGNTVLCLAEKYHSTPQTGHPPLEQMSRLGGLLSRFLIFLTARQQVRSRLYHF